MEGLGKMRGIDKAFWQNRKVFVTGHTGFKGSWLCLWLSHLGADVTGYALEPPTNPSLYDLCQLETRIRSIIGDVRDYKHLFQTISDEKPEILIHMAAQPLVRDSYVNPVETYEINVMGTVNVLEASRHNENLRVVINVTTDKCYENREWFWGYRENEPLGGFDPYSSSKACSELVTSSYRNSFYNKSALDNSFSRAAVASVRAGNVIGGGDWAKDRLVPDCISALLSERIVTIRNPAAIRPWQHVLDPLCGYMLLAESLYSEGEKYEGAWNFGPDESEVQPVQWIVSRLCNKWGGGEYQLDSTVQPHEANYLKLDCSKARNFLQWKPRLNLDSALDLIVAWTRAYKNEADLAGVCLNQIVDYMNIEMER